LWAIAAFYFDLYTRYTPLLLMISAPGTPQVRKAPMPLQLNAVPTAGLLLQNPGVRSEAATMTPILSWPEIRFARRPSSKHEAKTQKALKIRVSRMLGGKSRKDD